MKKITTILTIVLLQTATLFANSENDTLSKQKQCFYDAKTELENMLSGKIPLDYERAVFITENAYWSNEINYNLFKSTIKFHAKNVMKLAEANRNEQSQNFNATLLETEEQKREKYQNLLYNWAIFTYLTDTTILNTSVFGTDYVSHHMPYGYSYCDPMGVLDWKNSQVFNLLDNNKANCYAMTSFFKILAEHFKTDASIGVAPGHVYITHINQKGTHYNIELANRAFPGAGSIMTLTYTPVEAVRNGIAMRTLDLKQSVALCLIYLAKGYEHKFDAKTDDFLYQCAEITLKYDSLNLNAMLLKAEVLEAIVLNNNKTIAQLQTNKEFKEYQNLIVTLFEKGYREMPLDMKNLIINRLQNDSIGLIRTDHTPKGFQTINPKDDRYATLSWGMFDEVHEPKLIEQYGRTLLNTKTKKITKFVIADTLYNNYPIDPVVFAWQIDPLTRKFPSESPYIAFGDNPILNIDVDGMYKYPKNKASDYTKTYPMLTKYLSQNIKNDVMNSQIIMAGMLKYSGGNLTETEINKAVTWGSGPTIVFNPEYTVNDDGTGTYGYYSSATNTIHLSKNFADKVEAILAGDGSDEEKQAALYEFYATTTHETVHYGDYLDGQRQDSDDPSGFGGEPGAAFMQDIFESKDVKIEGETYRVNQGSVHGDSKELINMQKEQGQTEVLPTLPKK